RDGDLPDLDQVPDAARGHVGTGPRGRRSQHGCGRDDRPRGHDRRAGARLRRSPSGTRVMTASALGLRGLTKHFGDVVAVDGIDLEVQPGEFVTLLGPSGSGKTTTLRMIAGFTTQTSGTIEVGGLDMSHVPPYKRDVGMVFQNYALFPHMTAAQN